MHEAALELRIGDGAIAVLPQRALPFARRYGIVDPTTTGACVAASMLAQRRKVMVRMMRTSWWNMDRHRGCRRTALSMLLVA